MLLEMIIGTNRYLKDTKAPDVVQLCGSRGA